MHMTIQKAVRSGVIGSIKIFCDGKPLDQVVEFMTGKNGFAHCLESPPRIIGGEFARCSVRGNITCIIEP